MITLPPETERIIEPYLAPCIDTSMLERGCTDRGTRFTKVEDIFAILSLDGQIQAATLRFSPGEVHNLHINPLLRRMLLFGKVLEMMPRDLGMLMRYCAAESTTAEASLNLGAIGMPQSLSWKTYNKTYTPIVRRDEGLRELAERAGFYKRMLKIIEGTMRMREDPTSDQLLLEF